MRSIYIVYHRITGELVRVVDCKASMVTMTGQWSNQYEFVSWDTCFKLLSVEASPTLNSHPESDEEAW